MAAIQKIDVESQSGVDNSLNLFSLPPTTVAFNKSTLRELQPITSLDNSGPYCFRIFSDNQFIDLSRTWFYLETCIEKQAGAGAWIKIANTPDDQNVSVCNNFGNSFIKRLDIKVNGKEIFNSGTNYAYRSYLNHELFTSNETRKTLSEASCYYADTHANPAPNYHSNDGFTNRKARFAQGQTCYTMSKLDFDLAEQSNLFINNVDVLFTIYRNDDDWIIIAPSHSITADVPAGVANATKYRIKVLAMKIYIVTVDVVQSLQNAIAKHLTAQPAKYALRKVEVRNFYLGPGRQDLVYNVFQSTVPRRLIVGFVNRTAFIGDKTKSPFFFENANVRTISVEAGGNTWPAIPYEFNFAENKFIRGFVDMYEHLNLIGQPHSINLTMPKYHRGWTFFTFNLTSTLKDTSAFELVKNSTTVIKVLFNSAIADPGYEMIVFAEFDQIITANSERVIQLSGTV
jgi:hypothetical protein